MRQVFYYSHRPLRVRPEAPPHFVDGSIYLFEACEHIGKAKFPNAWTGDELLARRAADIGTVAHPPKVIFRADALPLPQVGSNTVLGRRDRASSDIWAVTVPSGGERFDSREAAEKAYNDSKAKIAEMALAEREARKRFDAVVLIVCHWLANPAKVELGRRNEERAYALDRTTGNERPIPNAFWRSHHAGGAFEMWTPNNWKNPNHIYAPDIHIGGNRIRVVGNVILRESDLAALVAQVQSEARGQTETAPPFGPVPEDCARIDTADTPVAVMPKAAPAEEPRKGPGRAPRTELTNGQLKTVAEELKRGAKFKHDGTIEWCAAKLVAGVARVTDRTVQNWRDLPAYQAAVMEGINARRK